MLISRTSCLRPEASDVVCVQIRFRSPPPTATIVRGRRAGLGVSVEDVVGREGDALKESPVHIRARMRQSQTDDGAFRIRIVDRRPFAGEIGEKNKSVGAWRRCFSLRRQRGHRRLRT